MAEEEADRVQRWTAKRRAALVLSVLRGETVDLLANEDFGMRKLGPNAAEDLLEVFVRRHE